MMTQTQLELVLALVTGICTAIPLIMKLVETVRAAAKEKNWNLILALTLELMERAEEKFDTGHERKQWVLESLRFSASQLNYDLDQATLDKLDMLIDSICSTAKIITAAKSEGGGADDHHD